MRESPDNELDGLLKAFSTYTTIHAFDGYNPDDIGKLAKDKPNIRSQYNTAMELKRRMEERAGKQNEAKSFKNTLGII
jgi:hypothetical protein